MKPIYIISFLMLFAVGGASAQYQVDFDKAPLNPIPMKYTLEHFQLQGPVKMFNDGLKTYIFNEDGLLVADENPHGLLRTYEYEDGKLVSYSSTSHKKVTHYISYDDNNCLLKSNTPLLGGERYEYKDGRLFEVFSMPENDLAYRYEYDEQGRLLKTQGFFSGALQTVTTYKYLLKDEFLLVKSFYSASDSNEESILVTYYKDGFYQGEKPNEDIEFDEYGNPLNMVFRRGNPWVRYGYQYFGGVKTGEEIPLKNMDQIEGVVQVEMHVEKPQNP